MRKYIQLTIVTFFFILLPFFIPNQVKAQVCFCPGGGAWTYCDPDPNIPGNFICQTTGSGGDGAHQCCDSCGGSCEAPTGGAVGGAAQCTAPQNINCSSSAAVNYGSYTTSGVTPTVCQLGNAQTYEGTCNYYIPNPEDPDNPICRTNEVITYACCPAGSIGQCSIINQNSTYQAGNPEDAYDTFVGTAQVVTNQRWGQIGWHCDDDECTSTSADYGWIYTYGTTNVYQDYDRVCGCQVVCDVNAWSAWGACSATCGGGTQTRTNACGTQQSQACNTQSCQGPWWQVKDGDVTTNGDLVSDVGSGFLFDIVGLGGYPGVPVYGNAFNLTSTSNRISATMWNSDTTTTQSRVFNYAFFDNLIPDDVNFNDVSTLVSGGTPYTDGYEWYTASGDVSTSGDINIGSRKVILFVENGNFNINGRINLTDGVGFFGVFVDGNIVISPTVAGAPSIEGVYLSDGSFSTGAGTSQLHLRGSVASFGGVSLQRDLSNDITAAELFEFAPDQMLLFPEKLMFRRTKWTEVAP